MTDAWRVLLGSVGFLVVLAVLLSPMDLVFAQQVAFLDTELREAGPTADVVRTKLDFGDEEQLESIPQRLGDWRAVRAYDWVEVARLLDANVLLSRDYARADLLQPVNLLVIQSGNVTSFHPAPVCYTVQGWDMDEGRTARIPLTNASWATPAWLGPNEPRVFSGNLSAKVSEVTRPRADGTIDKRTVLYVYVKQETGNVLDAITWIRLEMQVTSDTTLDQALPVLGDLFRSVVPSLFDADVAPAPIVAETLVARWGATAWVLMGIAIAAPVVVAVPWRRR